NRSCPLSYQDVVKALTRDDPQCKGDGKTIMRTMMISETAQPVKKASNNFRLVITRACPSPDATGKSGTQQNELFIAPLGSDPTQRDSAIEMIGFQADDGAKVDATDGSISGVYNYYSFNDFSITGQPEWHFYGSSRNFI